MESHMTGTRGLGRTIKQDKTLLSFILSQTMDCEDVSFLVDFFIRTDKRRRRCQGLGADVKWVWCWGKVLSDYICINVAWQSAAHDLIPQCCWCQLVCVSTFTYGHELWVVTERMKLGYKQLEGVSSSRWLSFALRIGWEVNNPDMLA